MSWMIQFLKDADADYQKLDGSQRKLVDKALEKVKQNPLPVHEGGYGKPLANKNGSNLSGLLKIKLKASGIRIVYKLVRVETSMLIVVIGMREDEAVYSLANKRKEKYNF